MNYLQYFTTLLILLNFNVFAQETSPAVADPPAFLTESVWVNQVSLEKYRESYGVSPISRVDSEYKTNPEQNGSSPFIMDLNAYIVLHSFSEIFGKAARDLSCSYLINGQKREIPGKLLEENIDTENVYGGLVTVKRKILKIKAVFGLSREDMTFILTNNPTVVKCNLFMLPTTLVFEKGLKPQLATLKGAIDETR